MKSTADSVALLFQWNQPLEEGFGDDELDTASDSAKKLKTSISSGNEDRRHRCIASKKVTKMPMNH